MFERTYCLLLLVWTRGWGPPNTTIVRARRSRRYRHAVCTCPTTRTAVSGPNRPPAHPEAWRPTQAGLVCVAAAVRHVWVSERHRAIAACCRWVGTGTGTTGVGQPRGRQRREAARTGRTRPDAVNATRAPGAVPTMTESRPSARCGQAADTAVRMTRPDSEIVLRLPRRCSRRQQTAASRAGLPVRRSACVQPGA